MGVLFNTIPVGLVGISNPLTAIGATVGLDLVNSMVDGISELVDPDQGCADAWVE